MFRRNHQKRKLNNKGMTLVEVIVTITILALVSGTLLSAFVSVMRMSTKSRDVHRATTVAQNVMEGINLKNVEEMAYQFNYPIRYDDSGTQINNFTVYPATMFQYATNNSVGEIIEYTDPVSGNVSTELATDKRSLVEYKTLTDAYDKATTASAYMSDVKVDAYDFIQDEKGKYIYYMRNIENDGRYYNAKITLDASPYSTGGYKSLNVNDDTLISVPTIDSTYDAVEVMKPNLDSEALNQLRLLYPNDTDPIEMDDLTRYIVVNIENDLMIGTSGQYRTSVKVDYYYSCLIKNEDPVSGAVSYTPSGQIPIIGTNTVFDNEGAEAEKKLRNIYIYYYPHYDSTLIKCKDYITINNNDNMDIELYVIKQEPINSTMTQSEMINKEQAYGVTFDVKETTMTADSKSHIKLHTNWEENLGAVYTGYSYTTNQAKYLLNGTVPVGDVFSKTDIKNKKAYDRIYDVTVEIYSSEKSSSLSDFTSSTTMSDWFNPDNHLITVNSSISQ